MYRMPGRMSLPDDTKLTIHYEMKKLKLLMRRMWLGVRLIAGTYRGILVHADRRGKITPDVDIAGLNIHAEDPRFEITLGGAPIMTISPRIIDTYH